VITKANVFLAVVVCILLSPSNIHACASSDFKRAYQLYEDKQYSRALIELHSLADANDAAAKNLLGKIYFFGNGVEPDYDKSFQWRLEAANQGYPDAQYYLGGMYLFGYGTPKDIEKAIYWLSKAADNHHLLSELLLGQVLEDKRFADHNDLCIAVKLYQSGTDLGDPFAYFLLNRVLFNGKELNCGENQ
jgi:TPR repeat protein